MNLFIIQDWAGNTFQYNNKFNFGSHGTEKGVPLEFQSFEDAWEYIYENWDEEFYDDLFVVNKGKL